MAWMQLILTIGFTCSAFLVPNSNWIAKSYDWRIQDGYALMNPSHLKKSSLIFDASEKPLKWTSKYSSITFNQFGAGFPNSGMNEAGLVIEVLWLRQTQYESPNNKPVLNEIEWIQYNLDNFATIWEVKKNLNKYRIRKIYAEVHYFICDANNDCMTLEFLNGRAHTFSGSRLKFPSLTNNTYQKAKNNMSQYLGYGGNSPIPYGSYSSLERFARITDQARTINGPINPDKLFSILDTVEKIGYTRWHLLYNTKRKEIHFKTRFANFDAAKIKAWQEFKSCKDSETRFFHLSDWKRGNINTFENLNYWDNYWLVKDSLTKVMGEDVPKNLIRTIAQQPFSFQCAE